MKSYLHADYGQAFVPVDDVCPGWNFLKPLLTQYRATATFISYFESNWLIRNLDYVGTPYIRNPNIVGIPYVGTPYVVVLK